MFHISALVITVPLNSFSAQQTIVTQSMFGVLGVSSQNSFYYSPCFLGKAGSTNLLKLLKY